MAFPDTFLKGIPAADFVAADGTISAALFHFDNQHTRTDGWIEQSINWEDNDGALALTLNQRKQDGQLQFRVGVARLPRIEIDTLSRLPTVNGIISYERSPLPDNTYHGNLLLKSGTPSLTMKRIAGFIACCVSGVIRRPSPD